MLFTLSEALRQIDPHVVLDDGVTARTVEQLLFSVDNASPLEYFIGKDSEGRLLIFEIDSRGFAVYPAAFVEKKNLGSVDSPRNNFQPANGASFLPRLA